MIVQQLSWHILSLLVERAAKTKTSSLAAGRSVKYLTPIPRSEAAFPPSPSLRATLTCSHLSRVSGETTGHEPVSSVTSKKSRKRNRRAKEKLRGTAAWKLQFSPFRLHIRSVILSLVLSNWRQTQRIYHDLSPALKKKDIFKIYSVCCFETSHYQHLGWSA